MVDAVVREFRSHPDIGVLSVLFYADDGRVAGFDPVNKIKFPEIHTYPAP